MAWPKYFVVLASMRTGSNLLEELLRSVAGLEMYGELFNPHFFGSPETDEAFGFSLEARDKDPIDVLEAMKDAGEALPGFRLFPGHDPRVFRHVLRDDSCAKIILNRRPIDSFVSLQIARKTGQWWLGDAKSAKHATIHFDPDAYALFAGETRSHSQNVERQLQTSGQVAFRLDYADLGNSDVLDGLVKFLDVKGKPDTTRVRARVQNPVSVEDRLSNPEVAAAVLADEAADIGDPPIHEPDRGPGVRFFRAAGNLPLLYMPIRGAGHDPVPDWLSKVAKADVLPPFTQRDLRRWKRQHPGHLSFSVLRHPLPRAYHAFCANILPEDLTNFADVRAALVERYGVQLPKDHEKTEWTLEKHRAAFLSFLHFLKVNLSGQTSVRVDSVWATQERLLSAIASLIVPDRVFRDHELGTSLCEMSEGIGAKASHAPKPFGLQSAYELEDVVNGEIQDAVGAAYRRDFMMFGFSEWKP